MTSNSKPKSPRLSVVLAVLFSSAVGMLYLGKGRNALLYFFAVIIFFGISPLAIHYQIIDFTIILIATTLLIRLVGVTHCYFTAKNLKPGLPHVWFSKWYWIITLVYIIPIVIVLFIRMFLYESFYIPASPMMPSLMRGDTLFVSKYSYGYSKYSLPFITQQQPKRGDIVVFKLPNDPKIVYIQRVIGLPGESIQIKNSILYINGQAIERRSEGNFGQGPPYSDNAKTYSLYIEILPNGRQYQILEVSDDTRFDTTPIYVVPEGHFFTLGDHRDRSRDSRFLKDVGYIPFENLVGKLALIYWNDLAQRIVFLE